MKQYKDLLIKILTEGEDSDDRTGTGTRAIVGAQMRFDMADGFPLVTIKKTNFKALMVELLWFMKGDTKLKYLHDHGVKIWDEWAKVDADGDLSILKGYGYQWRNFFGVDQLKEVVNSIRNNPQSRRHIVTAWNPAELDQCSLPPCHMTFQFVVKGNKLHLHLLMRSNDFGLGNPFNVAQYSALLHIMAKLTGYIPGEFIWTGVDVHIYKNHIEGLASILNREPYPLPTFKMAEWINSSISLDEFLEKVTIDDFSVENYQYHPFVKLPVAV